MTLSRFVLILAAVSALFMGCTSEASTEGTDPKPAVVNDHDHANVYTATCGCTLEEAGNKCGNYVRIDGKYIPIEGDVGLGAMEFCGKGKVDVELDGEVKDGKFAATSFALHEH